MTDAPEMATAETQSSKSGPIVEVRVPASSGNLGAGFDCFGLALPLYLTVQVSVDRESDQPFRMTTHGMGYGTSLPATSDNLILRAMNLAADEERITLPPLYLEAKNEIPLSSGLGSSAAAIIAGLTICAALGDQNMTIEQILRYAVQLEGHADNVAASLLGGWVVTSTIQDGNAIALKKQWPSDIKVIIVSPHFELETAKARSVLAPLVSHSDAVHNVQRAALFTAAIEGHRYDLLWEAMRDRLHQEKRQPLVPGLGEALAIPRQPGLLGLALSGAGPSVIALAQDHFNEIDAAIIPCFERHGIETTVWHFDADTSGRQLTKLS